MPAGDSRAVDALQPEPIQVITLNCKGAIYWSIRVFSTDCRSALPGLLPANEGASADFLRSSGNRLLITVVNVVQADKTKKRGIQFWYWSYK